MSAAPRDRGRRRRFAWFAGLYLAALCVYAVVVGIGHMIVVAAK